MQWWEIERYIAGIRRAERPGWEQTRLAGLWQISSMGGKVKLGDLITFSWDKDQNNTSMPSEEEIEELRQMMREENARIRKEQP